MMIQTPHTVLSHVNATRLDNALRFNGTPAKPPQSVGRTVGLPRFSHVQHMRFGISLSSNDILESFSEQVGGGSQSRVKSVMPFRAFLNGFLERPGRMVRNSNQYVVDAMDYWNGFVGIGCDDRVEVLGQKIKPQAWAGRPWRDDYEYDTGVSGQGLVLANLYRSMKEDAKQPFSERIRILNGPNASAKTITLETLGEAISTYSETDDGVMYTFHWVFADEDDDDFQMMLPTGSPGGAVNSTGDIDSKDIVVRLPADMNSNPFFLLPKNVRGTILKQMQQEQQLPEGFNVAYAMREEMDPLSRKIYAALENVYSQELSHIRDSAKRKQMVLAKILRHVQVVRVKMNQNDGRGVVKMPAAETNDAMGRVITPKVRWADLPRRIQAAFTAQGIQQVTGPIASANRGLLWFDDMWKVGDRYTYMLQTAEKRTVSIRDQETGTPTEVKVDLSILGTANDKIIAAQEKAAQHSDASDDSWRSFKERTVFMPMGYDLHYRNNVQVLSPKFDVKFCDRATGPYALEAMSLFATMSYLIPTGNKDYYNSVEDVEMPGVTDGKRTLFKLVDKLTLLEKALLYQGEDVNGYEVHPDKQKYTVPQKRRLKKHLGTIAQEYNLGVGKGKFLFYEGGMGVTTRELQNLIEAAVYFKPKQKTFTVLEMIEFLEDAVSKGFDYTREMQAYMSALVELEAYEDLGQIKHVKPTTLLNSVKEYYGRKIRYDVYNALEILKSDEHYKTRMQKYVKNVEHLDPKGGATAVEPEYRFIRDQEFPVLSVMHRMEAVFEPDLITHQDESSVTVDEEKAKRFRENVIVRRASQYRNKGDDQPDYLGEVDMIYHDLIDRLKAHDIKDQEDVVVEFIRDVQRGGVNTRIVSKAVELRRRNYEKAFEGLKAKGYPEDSIPKMIEFAFQGTDEYDAAVSGSDSD